MSYKWVPIILDEKCTGCGLCVEACGPKCLKITDSIAVLARPDTCGSEEHCIGVCNDDAIHMAWVPMPKNNSRGKWREEVRVTAMRSVSA
ncbi:MAG: 4Fe-4S binding protein [Terriglobales bacterium]